MTVIKDNQEGHHERAHIVYTRDSSYVGCDIQDRQLAFAVCIRANSCVDRLLTDASVCMTSQAVFRLGLLISYNS